jgi:transposase
VGSKTDTNIRSCVLSLTAYENLKQPNEEKFCVLKRISTKDYRKKIRLRAKIILCRLEGLTYRKITEKLNCCKDTIKFTVDKWNEYGIGSILAWKRKIFLGKNFKRRNVIERLLSFHPDCLKFPFSNWSLRTIKSFLSDWLNTKISLSTIRRDLKILNFRYRKVEDKLINKPVDYEEKKLF